MPGKTVNGSTVYKPKKSAKFGNTQMIVNEENSIHTLNNLEKRFEKLYPSKPRSLKKIKGQSMGKHRNSLSLRRKTNESTNFDPTQNFDPNQIEILRKIAVTRIQSEYKDAYDSWKPSHNIDENVALLALNDIFKSQIESILLELKKMNSDDYVKQTHWMWWICPTNQAGKNDPLHTYLTHDTIPQFLSFLKGTKHSSGMNGDYTLFDKWKESLILLDTVFDYEKDMGETMNDGDRGRIFYFCQYWLNKGIDIDTDLKQIIKSLQFKVRMINNVIKERGHLSKKKKIHSSSKHRSASINFENEQNRSRGSAPPRSSYHISKTKNKNTNGYNRSFQLNTRKNTLNHDAEKINDFKIRKFVEEIKNNTHKHMPSWFFSLFPNESFEYFENLDMVNQSKYYVYLSSIIQLFLVLSHNFLPLEQKLIKEFTFFYSNLSKNNIPQVIRDLVDKKFNTNIELLKIMFPDIFPEKKIQMNKMYERGIVHQYSKPKNGLRTRAMKFVSKLNPFRV
jgi:hypothetical protein